MTKFTSLILPLFPPNYTKGEIMLWKENNYVKNENFEYWKSPTTVELTNWLRKLERHRALCHPDVNIALYTTPIGFLTDNEKDVWSSRCEDSIGLSTVSSWEQLQWRSDHTKVGVLITGTAPKITRAQKITWGAALVKRTDNGFNLFIYHENACWTEYDDEENKFLLLPEETRPFCQWIQDRYSIKKLYFGGRNSKTICDDLGNWVGDIVTGRTSLPNFGQNPAYSYDDVTFLHIV